MDFILNAGKDLVADLTLDNKVLKYLGGKLVNHSRERVAVKAIQLELSVPERRACLVLEQVGVKFIKTKH